MPRLTKEQKRLQSIENTTMPKVPFSTREDWSKTLAQEVSGKLVKVGWADTTDPQVGVAFSNVKDHDPGYSYRVEFVDIVTGLIEEIDSPNQVYWVKSIPVNWRNAV
jgi:hypothetical protein